MPVITRSGKKPSFAGADRILRRLQAEKLAEQSLRSSPVDRGTVQLEVVDGEGIGVNRLLKPLPLTLVDGTDIYNKSQTADGCAKALLPLSFVKPDREDDHEDMVVPHSGRDLRSTSSMKWARDVDGHYGPGYGACAKRLLSIVLFVAGLALFAAIVFIVGSDIGYQYYNLRSQFVRRQPFTINCNRLEFGVGLPADLIVLTQQFCDNETAWVQNCCFGEAVKLVAAEYTLKVTTLACRVLSTFIGIAVFFLFILSGCCEKFMSGLSTEAGVLGTYFKLRKESSAANNNNNTVALRSGTA